MGSEWVKGSLGELLEITSSKRIFHSDYRSSGVPFYRSKEIIERSKGNSISTEIFISEDRFKAIRDKFGAPSSGDILLTSVGTLGVAYLVRDEDRFYFKDGNLTWFRNFSDLLLPRYLHIWFSSSVAKSAIDRITIGSTQQALTISALKTLEVQLPPVETQKSIVGILGSLNDKIELNRQMNTSLEAMAQALFKSWFVDFDPVIDNALAAGNPIPNELAERAERRAKAAQQQSPEHPHTLPAAIREQFPDRFMFTETMGWVPEGWKHGRLSEFTQIISKGTTPSKSAVTLAPDKPEIQFLKVRDISDNNEINIDGLERISRSIHEGVLKRSILKEGDILFSIAGTIGRTAIVTHELNYSNANQALAFIRPTSKTTCDYIHQTFKSEQIKDIVHSRTVQAVQANFSLSELASIPILDPGTYILDAWHGHTCCLFEKTARLREESRGLAKLRDTLLPKLLSGQLRIPQAEQLLAEAL